MSRKTLFLTLAVVIVGFAGILVGDFWLAGWRLPPDPRSRILFVGLLAYICWQVGALLRRVAKGPPSGK